MSELCIQVFPYKYPDPSINIFCVLFNPCIMKNILVVYHVTNGVMPNERQELKTRVTKIWIPVKTMCIADIKGLSSI
jgi:hypothetical protein